MVRLAMRPSSGNPYSTRASGVEVSAFRGGRWRISGEGVEEPWCGSHVVGLTFCG
jgi:hypothetical protein